MKTATPEVIGEYTILFTSLADAMQKIDSADAGGSRQVLQTTQLSEEIERLRLITEQLNLDAAPTRSITIG